MASLQRSGFWMWFRIVKATVGLILGILAGIVFTFVYGNVTAGLWAFISSILSSIVLHQHLLFKKSKLGSTYNAFRFKIAVGVGIIISILSFSCTVYYFVEKTKLSQETYPIRDSYLISGVWGFMTLKWSLLLIFYSYKYKVKLDGEREYNTF